MSFIIFALLQGWKTLLGKSSFTWTLSLSISEMRILGCLSKDASEAVILPALGKNFSFYIQRKKVFDRLFCSPAKKLSIKTRLHPFTCCCYGLAVTKVSNWLQFSCCAWRAYICNALENTLLTAGPNCVAPCCKWLFSYRKPLWTSRAI